VSGIGCCPYIQSAPIPSSGRFILGVLVWVSCYTINRLSRKRRKGQWGTVYVLYHLKKGVLNPNPCGLTGEWRVSEERTENRVADEVDASLTAHTQTHIHARSFLHHVFGYLRRSFYMYNIIMYTPQQHAAASTWDEGGGVPLLPEQSPCAGGRAARLPHQTCGCGRARARTCREVPRIHPGGG